MVTLNYSYYSIEGNECYMTFLTSIYHDLAGIDSIYAQVTAMKVEEIQTQVAGKERNSLDGKIGASPFGVGLLNAEINTSLILESSSMTNARLSIPDEARSFSLEGYLGNEGLLIQNKYEILSKYKEGETNFISADITFDTDYKSWDHFQRRAKKFGFITFFVNGNAVGRSSYDDSDSYYKNPTTYGYSIIMNMSIDKMKSFGDIRSHFGVSLRLCNFIDVPLNVFGIIWKVGDIFQIKPLNVYLA